MRFLLTLVAVSALFISTPALAETSTLGSLFGGGDKIAAPAKTNIVSPKPSATPVDPINSAARMKALESSRVELDKHEAEVQKELKAQDTLNDAKKKAAEKTVMQPVTKK